MKKPIIRLARENDAADILKIYEPYVKETAITFECETPSLTEFTNRVKEISCDYPYIVSALDKKIIGYAYAHKQMEREAYQWNAELSVYVDMRYFRLGVGKALYGAVIEILRIQNVRNVYGGVTLPNENSENLHVYFGFTILGTYHNTGFKLGGWHDVTWFEKTIGDYDSKPKPVLSIQEIDKTVITKILNRNAESLHCELA
ncbi:MAG: GNAT family N-acetyltransferase [Deltaproteobacteria bacterium]|jgi:phosphinothricin acetyltransferase|nr:GNAT family N-acetyltransferase [Deltaproteobacteria bacterium]